MNRIHRLYCRSAHWRRTVRDRLVPWVVGRTPLGDDVLEVGPGPGLVADALEERVARLTCVEVDPALANALAKRKAGSRVTVACADATALPFPDARFTGAVSCTMLHHVPSAALQDRLLAEVARVLAPGAWFVGSDSLSGRVFRLVHWGDTLVPVDPDTLAARLEKAGFAEVRVGRDRAGKSFRFRARRA